MRFWYIIIDSKGEDRRDERGKKMTIRYSNGTERELDTRETIVRGVFNKDTEHSVWLSELGTYYAICMNAEYDIKHFSNPNSDIYFTAPYDRRPQVI